MRKTTRRLIRALYNIDEAYFVNEKKKRLFDAELNVMYALDDGKEHSQAEISRDWLVPKTTVNTIVKRWEKEGYVVQQHIQGKRREMQIVLTEAGKEYARTLMTSLYRAEDAALKKTIERYSDEFISAIEYFGSALREEFERDTDR